MEQTWLTVDELAAVLKVSPKSIRRAYRKGEIPVDRFCRFVRFDLERVKEAPARRRGMVRPLSLPKRNCGTAQRDQAAPAGGARSGPAPD
jgi:excisionase family DNA binding protein